MTPQKKANELVLKFLPKMYCYMGSGMLTNTYDEGVANSNAVQCAIFCVDETISQWEYIDTYLSDLNGELNPNLKYWYNVKQELLKMK
ncbi:hypothetical protein CMU94_02160 [Elizabethkingia anophelis]|nr:hypothetical protein [Elizabethkingia anophelis]